MKTLSKTTQQNVNGSEHQIRTEFQKVLEKYHSEARKSVYDRLAEEVDFTELKQQCESSALDFYLNNHKSYTKDLPLYDQLAFIQIIAYYERKGGKLNARKMFADASHNAYERYDSELYEALSDNPVEDLQIEESSCIDQAKVRIQNIVSLTQAKLHAIPQDEPAAILAVTEEFNTLKEILKDGFKIKEFNNDDVIELIERECFMVLSAEEREAIELTINEMPF